MGHPIAGGEGKAEFEFLNFLRSEDNLCVFTQVLLQAFGYTAVTD